MYKCIKLFTNTNKYRSRTRKEGRGIQMEAFQSILSTMKWIKVIKGVINKITSIISSTFFFTALFCSMILHYLRVKANVLHIDILFIYFQYFAFVFIYFLNSLHAELSFFFFTSYSVLLLYILPKCYLRSPLLYAMFFNYHIFDINVDW